MTAQRKRPKPIRLTQVRALGLVEAAERGLVAMRDQISEIARDPVATLEEMQQARELDDIAAAAVDGIELIRARYLPPPADPETLF